IRSLALPSAAVLFKETLWSRYSIQGQTPNGESANIEFNLVTEVGSIFSKCESVRSRKRAGDAFDIYYLLSGPKGAATSGELKALASSSLYGFDTQLLKLRTYLDENPLLFNQSVEKYMPKSTPVNYAEFVYHSLFSDVDAWSPLPRS